MFTRSFCHWTTLAIVAIVLAGSQTAFAQEGEERRCEVSGLGSHGRGPPVESAHSTPYDSARLADVGEIGQADTRSDADL